MKEKGKIRFGVDGIYSIKDISKGQAIILGLQHTFAMFGATILVPILTGLPISTTLLMAGLGTLLFHLITGGKVPVFLGSSFAFLGGYAAVAPFGEDGTPPAPEMLARANGGILVAGAIYLIVALLIKLVGVQRVMRFFPPIVTGPIIISIGLILAPSAIGNASGNWLLAVVAIAIVIIANIYGRGMIKIIPFILGIVGSYIVALIIGVVDFSGVQEVTSVVQLPIYPEYFATFDLSAILTIAPIALATDRKSVV